jgi:putative oxidoreductase
MDDKIKSQDAGIFARCYGMFVKAAECLQSPLLLGIRLYWGWQFFVDGKGKLMNLDNVTSYFTKLNIPYPHVNAVAVGINQCVCGLLLAAGFGSRVVGTLLAFNMIVAFLTAEIDKVKNIFHDPDKFVTADPFLFLFASVIIVAFGPGCISVDALIKRLRGSGPKKTS